MRIPVVVLLSLLSAVKASRNIIEPNTIEYFLNESWDNANKEEIVRQLDNLRLEVDNGNILTGVHTVGEKSKTFLAVGRNLPTPVPQSDLDVLQSVRIGVKSIEKFAVTRLEDENLKKSDRLKWLCLLVSKDENCQLLERAMMEKLLLEPLDEYLKQLYVAVMDRLVGSGDEIANKQNHSFLSEDTDLTSTYDLEEANEVEEEEEENEELDLSLSGMEHVPIVTGDSSRENYQILNPEAAEDSRNMILDDDVVPNVWEFLDRNTLTLREKLDTRENDDYHSTLIASDEFLERYGEGIKQDLESNSGTLPNIYKLAAIDYRCFSILRALEERNDDSAKNIGAIRQELRNYIQRVLTREG